MSFEITQLPALTFCGLHMKPHGLIRLSEHYNLCIDPELDHGKCEIQQIPCVCVACTNMLDKPLAPSVDHIQQLRYQPDVECTY